MEAELEGPRREDRVGSCAGAVDGVPVSMHACMYVCRFMLQVLRVPFSF